jgi:hypothetical protein
MKLTEFSTSVHPTRRPAPAPNGPVCSVPRRRDAVDFCAVWCPAHNGLVPLRVSGLGLVGRAKPELPALTPKSVTIATISVAGLDLESTLQAGSLSSVGLEAQKVATQVTLEGSVRRGTLMVPTPVQPPRRRSRGSMGRRCRGAPKTSLCWLAPAAGVFLLPPGGARVDRRGGPEAFPLSYALRAACRPTPPDAAP